MLRKKYLISAGAIVAMAGAGVSVAACGGSTPSASQIVKSDGYHVMNVGGTNTDPTDISSEAFGTAGSIPSGNAEIVIVLTSTGVHKATSVENKFNSLGTGLTATVSGSNVIKVTGPDTAWIALGEIG